MTDPWAWSSIRFLPIGRIRTPFPEPAGTPVQTTSAVGSAGHIELDPELVEGLDTQSHGVFATRSPARPNPIGLSVVRLIRIDGARIDIEDVDMIDGTPLLDIKPYVPAFDARDDVRIGWYAERLGGLAGARADDRFDDR